MTEQRRIVTQSPENSETPLADVHGWVTPTRLFFVRNHFDVPTVDRNEFRLQIHGAVERPMEWTWDDLAALPERSLFATVECAGNGVGVVAVGNGEAEISIIRIDPHRRQRLADGGLA